MASKFGGAPKCPRCNTSVYAAELVLGAGGSWHKRCFTCKACRKGVDSTTCAEHEGEIYCKSCHAKSFGPKGYGFAGGKAFLAHDGDRPAGPLQTDFDPEKVEKALSPAAEPSPTFARKQVEDGVCPRCTKRVYLAEQVLGAGAKWHKACFRCFECGKSVDSTTVAEKDGEVFCRPCHGKMFGPKGFGYGNAVNLTN